MAINVQVEKTGTENPLSLLRRFNKRIQGSGIMGRVRGNRYKSRASSRLTVKKHALKRLRRREEIDMLIKLGKMTERKPRR